MVHGGGGTKFHPLGISFLLYLMFYYLCFTLVFIITDSLDILYLIIQIITARDVLVIIRFSFD